MRIIGWTVCLAVVLSASILGHAHFIIPVTDQEKGLADTEVSRAVVLPGPPTKSIPLEFEADGKGFSDHRLALQLDRKVIKIEDSGTRMNMGIVFRDLGLYEKAIEQFRRSIQTKKKLGDADGEATELYSMGQVYGSLGDNSSALQCFEQALPLFAKLGKTEDEGLVLNNVGELFTDQGQYSRALDSFRLALAKFRSKSLVKNEASVQNNIGFVYSRLGLYERATDSYSASLALLRENAAPKDVAAAMMELAEVLIRSGKFEAGIKVAGDSVQFLKSAGIPYSETLESIADWYLDAGMLSQAEAIIGESGSLRGLGRLALMKRDWASALSYYSKERDSVTGKGSASDFFTAYVGLARALEGVKDYKKAEEAYLKALDASEEIRAAAKPSERGLFFEKQIGGFHPSAPYKGLARIRIRLNNPEGSLEISELLKSRSFASRIWQGAYSAALGAPREVIAKENSLINKISSLRGEINSSDAQTNKSRLDALTNQLRQAEKDLDALIVELKKKNPFYTSIKYPGPFRLNESSLEPEDRVIALEDLDTAVGVIFIHGKQIVKSMLVEWPRSDMEKEIRDLRQALDGQTSKDFASDVGSSIYKRLLSAVMSDVPAGAPVTIVPDGMFALIAFDALALPAKSDRQETSTQSTSGPQVDAKSEGRLFGDLYPFSLQPSLTALSQSRAASGKSRLPSGSLVVSSPIFPENLSSAAKLSSTRDPAGSNNSQSELLRAVFEARPEFFRIMSASSASIPAKELERIFRGKCVLLSGVNASKTNVISRINSVMDGFANVLFTTPAVMSENFPLVMEPFIALSIDSQGVEGFLKLSDITSIRLDTEIVAMTSCYLDTSGNGLPGQGLLNMGRAFQVAGVKSVLVSLWEVEQGVVIKLLVSFFDHLKSGKTKSLSLKRAKEDLRSQGYLQPHYWTGFILVGD